MNEIKIKKIVEMTEEFIRSNREELSDFEIDSVNDLYDDLSLELSRYQEFDEQYD